MERKLGLESRRFPPPHAPSPSHSPSSSPSRSPRHSRNFSKSIDPLLRDLSPSTTLRAFTAASSTNAGNSSDQLVRSIESASASERAFGARIAQTCRDIRVWCDEVGRWEWPGTFEAPPESERAVRGRRMLADHRALSHPTRRLDQDDQHDIHDNEIEFWGCLPRDMVLACDKRVDDVRDSLEELDVEELKNYVLNAHTQPRPIQPAYHTLIQSDDMTANLQRLDDFTALITATILQALPHLSRLNKLLNSWSVRLTVLRKIPGFLRELQNGKIEVEASWSAMARDIESGQSDTASLRSRFDSLRHDLGAQVTSLAGRLDNVLDDLEGQEDTFPDDWIDAFEALEASYGEWVAHTEREIMTRDLAFIEPKIVPPHEIGLGLGLTLNQDDEPAQPSEPSPSTQNKQPSDSLVLSNSDTANLGNGQVNGSIAEQPSEPRNENKSAAEISTPPLSESDLPRRASVQDRPSSIVSRPSSIRSRSGSLIAQFEEKQAVGGSTPSHSGTQDRSVSSVQTSSQTTLDDLPQKPPGESVRARAAFLNGGLERTQTLQRSNPSKKVRSFEHASQAFTNLFQRANAVEQPRSDSVSSRSSSLHKGSGSIRKGTGQPLSTSRASSLKSPGQSPVITEPKAGPISESGSSRQSSQPSISASTVEIPAKDAFVTPETRFGFEPSTRETESTIESAWNSPAPSDVPESWPPQTRLYRDETTDPKKPINVDFFEKMFTDSLPPSPDGNQSDYQGVSQMELARRSLSRQGSRGRTLGDGITLQTKQSSVDAAPQLLPSLSDEVLQGNITEPSSSASNGDVLKSEANTHDGSPTLLTKSTPSRDIPTSRPQTPQEPLSVTPPSKVSPGTGETPSPRTLGGLPPPPLNFAMQKRRRAASVTTENSPTKDGGVSAARTTPVRKSHHKKSLSNIEPLDRHVSRILSSLPNRIRFTPIESEIPTAPSPSPSKSGSVKSRSAVLRKSSRADLTLTPAQPDERARKSKSTSDPEVKLYHLSQEGERQPIKLYVRLVGEGERVMVRVGGGWADLGEYLRQYAEHHGHRTVSEGRLEIASVGGSDSKSIKVGGSMVSGHRVRTPVSRPGSVLEVRPTSRVSQRRRSSLATNARPSSSPQPMPNFNTTGNGNNNNNNNNNITYTPTRPSTANTGSRTAAAIVAVGSPSSPSKSTIASGSASNSGSGSRPSTADTSSSSASVTTAKGKTISVASSSSPAAQSTWSGADIGLAGPGGGASSKSNGGSSNNNSIRKKKSSSSGSGGNAELDAHKARWVEEMIERAKVASAEGKNQLQQQSQQSQSQQSQQQSQQQDGGLAWGDMGRIGGTRRMIFRGSSGTGPGTGTKGN